MLEKEIEADVCKYAREKGFLVYKFSSPNHVGVPDRLFLSPFQQVFWIEFKREGGKLTAIQDREIRKLDACGFPVYLIDSVDKGKEVIDHQVALRLVSMGALKEMMALFSEPEETRH